MGMEYHKSNPEETVINVLDNAMVTATDTELRLWFWDEEFNEYFLEGQWGTVEGGFQTENPEEAAKEIMEYIESWGFSEDDIKDTEFNLKKHFGI